jgi:hypothetical protein
MKWLRTSATGGQLLEPMSISELYRTYPDRSGVTTFPTAYARDGANIIFGPSVSGAIALDGVYYSLLPTLSASNTTNWYTANYPEVLLYGALMAAQPFIVGDPRIPIWATSLKVGLEALKEVEKRERKTDTPRSVQVR